ncbi:hypothetical protein K7X08_023255 [Anisodus acutangulus]|uniref:Protein kinase domain-containing protein n=1 Tax=Anisodus acutangulus TaxID=402998 RepID=A0A9Q1LHL0_9SOLA|nr:hypothetical protein K7X08_023255 [Anisodus acutangulus]
MYIESYFGKWVCEGAGSAGGLGENKARTYLRDTVSGLMYLHSHNIIHGDINPDNLLVTASGRVKICDFSVSQAFEVLSFRKTDLFSRTASTSAISVSPISFGVPV